MASERALAYGGREHMPDVRMLSDIKEVLYDPGILRKEGDSPIYYMYRDLALSRKDRDVLLENDLRYDITVIPPRMIGPEYIKTLGHMHPKVPGTFFSYTEIYEVLEGEAHYLLQKMEDERVVDVVLIEAGKHDKIVIPPNYGHITINPSNKELKMANLVSRSFKSVYDLYVQKRGGAYYELKTGLAKNQSYGAVPEIRRLKAEKVPELGLGKNDEIYSLVKKDVSALGFLNHPEDFDWLLRLYQAHA